MGDSRETGYRPTKVPAITVYFWVIKVLTTGGGESTSDYLIARLHPAVAVPLAGIALVVALVLQFSASRYVAWRYWLAVVMVAVFGTMAADVLHGGLGIPYLVSTLALAVVLAAVFVAWHWIEGTLSIHSIFTRRREAFYWGTVMATFAFGTAAGDLTATTLGWGYLYSGVMFTAAIAVVALAHLLTRRMTAAKGQDESTAAVLVFWLAYILTRPLGASFADWMGKPPSQGALGWGDGTVSLSLMIVIAVLVGYLVITHRDVDAGRSTA